MLYLFVILFVASICFGQNGYIPAVEYLVNDKKIDVNFKDNRSWDVII